jgi:hypothetical protein
MDYSNTPIVIGSTGGLGTGVVTYICQHAGVYMGANFNKFLDAQEFLPFYDKWVHTMLSGTSPPVDDEQNKKMFQDFLACVQRHKRALPNRAMPWGWKNARSMYLVPFFHALYPDMKFIHIVRDGRDIAFLKDPKQLLYHTRSFFGAQYDSLLIPYRLMLLWKATNLTIALYCEANMAGNYLRIRHEDLCENPQGIVKRLLHFVGIRYADVAALAAAIKRPDFFGRWHVFPVDLVEKVEELGGEALVKFGYL